MRGRALTLDDGVARPGGADFRSRAAAALTENADGLTTREIASALNFDRSYVDVRMNGFLAEGFVIVSKVKVAPGARGKRVKLWRLSKLAEAA